MLSECDVILDGRLAKYSYYDMDQVIESALSPCKKKNLIEHQGEPVWNRF